MPIESICQSCSKRLRVADEHAGKLARCPHCNSIYTVPTPSGGTLPSATSADPMRPLTPLSTPAPQDLPGAAPAPGSLFGGGASPSSMWRMKTPSGLVYGPVSKTELDRWMAEGRITAECQLMADGGTLWFPAEQIYPQLTPKVPAMYTGMAQPQPGANPFGEQAMATNPYAASPGGYYRQHYAEPHRGGLVLGLSIAGFFCCIFLSIASLIMGAIDLAAMNRGTMDPSGRGLTIAGMVIAGLSVAFNALSIILVVIGEM